jgi:hypothetical protein
MKLQELGRKTARGIIVYVVPVLLLAGVASQVVPLIKDPVLAMLPAMAAGYLAPYLTKVADKWIR